jgi:hypothetical protein
MSFERFRVRRYSRTLTAAAILAVVTGLTLAATGSAASPASASGAYVVGLVEQPVIAYDGGIAGLPATKPGKGQKVDPLDQNVARYVAHLDSRHDAVLQSVGGGQKIYDYRYAYNGFAATLTAAQVAALEKSGAVLSIEPVEEWAPDTSTTPEFLGLTGTGNLWAQLGGPSSGTNAANATGAGEGIVIGMLDTGIWPEHPSVSDRIGG